MSEPSCTTNDSWVHNYQVGDLVTIGKGVSVWRVQVSTPDRIHLVANRSLGPSDGRFLPTRNILRHNINRLKRVE